MRKGFPSINILQDQVVLIELWAKHDGIFELLSPAWILLLEEELNELLLVFFGFVGVLTVNNGDQANVLLRDLDFFRFWLFKFYLENYVDFFFRAF